MKKIKAYTTLALLKSHDPCEDGWITLISHLGKDYPEDKKINLLTILESNGVQHCVWALRATIQDCSKQSCLIAADCAESVLDIYKNKYPDDNRSNLAISAAAAYAAAATDAAAAYAVGIAASGYRAAYAAATADTGNAYVAYVAEKEERERQRNIIKKYLEF